MSCIAVKWTKVVISVVVALFLTSAASGTELSIPALKAKSGESVNIPIMIDLVDNLAGVKLVMKYDTEILTFKKALKTKQTSSLMHIVNSKKPGTVIAVMAGARGIKGKDFPILLFKFEVKKDLKSSLSTKMEIHEIQMMTDQLKDIKCSVKINPLVISADVNDKKSAQKSEKTEQEVKTSEESPKKSDAKNEQQPEKTNLNIEKPEQTDKASEKSDKKSSNEVIEGTSDN